MTKHPATPELSDWALLITGGLLWGASFMAVELALAAFEPLTVAATRIALGALILLAAAHLAGYRLPRLGAAGGPRIWAFACALALFHNALPFFLLSWGQQHVTSAFAGISVAAVPLFVLGLAHLFVPGDRLTPPRLIGVLLGIIGVYLLIGGGALASGDDLETIARFACVGAASAYAIAYIFTRHAPPVPLLQFSAAALVAATAMIVPLALILEGLPVPQAGEAVPLLALVYLGLGPTALATLILVRVNRTAGPTFMSQVAYHIPIWAVLFGVALLGETLPRHFLLALAIILAGIALSRLPSRATQA